MGVKGELVSDGQAVTLLRTAHGASDSGGGAEKHLGYVGALTGSDPPVERIPLC